MKLDKVLLPAREHHQINGMPAGIDSAKKGTDSKNRGLRRVWTTKEEEALLSILEKAVAEGSRCDNGTFKAGTMTQIEKELNLLLPNSGLKANPHIDSKQRKWKKQHRLIFNMLKTSGFRWNHVKKCVEVDDDAVWQSFVQIHSEARGWKDRPFPIYERLVNIYGKDHVTTHGAEAPVDMVDEINREEIREENGVDIIVVEKPSSPLSVHQPSSSHQIDRVSSETSSRKRRKAQTGSKTSSEKRRSDSSLTAGIEKICSTIEQVFTLYNQNMEMLVKRILDNREDRSDIVDELATMGLEQDEEIRALILILDKPSNISAFKSLKGEFRLAFVKMLLDGRLARC